MTDFDIIFRALQDECECSIRTLIIGEQKKENLVDSNLYWPAAMNPQRSKAIEVMRDLLSESGSKKGTVWLPAISHRYWAQTNEKKLYENAATGPPWKSSLRPSGQQLQRQTVSSLPTAARL
jgi:hypothetical protein